MDLSDLIAPEGVFLELKAKSKKEALQALAQRAANLTGLEERTILDTLLQREGLGSTGVGRGIAIPHSRLPGLKRIFTVFARLDGAIEFESLDGQPVDLIFLLLAPEHEGADHLKALARVSRLLREPSSIERLRVARDRTAIYSALTEPAVHAA